MTRFLELARKIEGRSARELLTRGFQMLNAASERWGLSSQTRHPRGLSFLSRNPEPASTLEELLARFRSRTSPPFFPGLTDREETLACLRATWPGAEAEIVARADRIVAGKFDLLGRRNLSFGNPIDWRFDPLSGKRTPLTHWSRIEHLDVDQVGEYKLTWELNRHGHFFILGQAYWCTGDERYAETFVAHLTAWMEANPPTRGINWTSSLEVAIRAIAWVWALHFFRASPRLTAEVFLRALQFLERHARHVERYLSTYFSPNTHLTGEALGLFVLGLSFPEFARSPRWRELGLRLLLEQLEAQVRQDGVYFEQASYYQRYTVDFYSQLIILCQANAIALPPAVSVRLQAMLEHLMWIQRPDGTTPLFGDDDGGRLVWLDGRAPSDFRAALSTGAALFAREDFRFAAQEPAEETLWLLGPEAVRSFLQLPPRRPPLTSRGFPLGGYFVMRDGWCKDANYLLVDCGPHGGLRCGHAHADALAIEVVARGDTVLADPGTFTYTSPRELRDHFRSTAAHSTLLVDGESSSVPGGVFEWRSVASCSLRSWVNRGRFDFFSGRHDGYHRLPAPARHTRSILFLKGDYWIMYDQISSPGEHSAEARFQFAPGIRLLREDGRLTAVGNGSRRSCLDLAVFGADGQILEQQSWFSPSFGERVAAPVSAVMLRRGQTIELISFLLPRRWDEQALSVATVLAQGGRAFHIRAPETLDEVLIRGEGARTVTDGTSTDAEWAWVRRSSVDGAVKEYVMIAGSRLSFGDREVFGCTGGAGFVAARREGSILLVETDATAGVVVDPLGAGEVRVNGEPVVGWGNH